MKVLGVKAARRPCLQEKTLMISIACKVFRIGGFFNEIKDLSTFPVELRAENRVSDRQVKARDPDWPSGGLSWAPLRTLSPLPHINGISTNRH
jgi:hypothetical protein